MSRTALDVLLRSEIGDDGFVAPPGAAWRIGTVAYARSGGALALVRKAKGDRPGYEFEGAWVLPGGMARSTPPADGRRAAEVADRSLHARVLLEAGLDLLTCHDQGFADELGPLVTSFSTSKGRRHTLVLVRRFEAASRSPLSTSDDSVAAAGWVELPPDWATMAPANLLAVAHMAWTGLDERSRTAAVPHVERALEACSAWALEMDLPPPAPPWAPLRELQSWRQGFP